MPKLHLMENKKTVSTFDLAEGEIVVGRDAACEIHLDDDAISRRHVRIFTLLGDAFLEDLGSSNGTYVNGHLTRKSVLNDGDVIQIGQRELLFSQPAESEPSRQNADNMDATMIIPPGNFGPETVAAKEKNRTREGISPVAYSAHEKAQPESRSRAPAGKQRSGGFWGWLRRLFQ